MIREYYAFPREIEIYCGLLNTNNRLTAACPRGHMARHRYI